MNAKSISKITEESRIKRLEFLIDQKARMGRKRLDLYNMDCYNSYKWGEDMYLQSDLDILKSKGFEILEIKMLKSKGFLFWAKPYIEIYHAICW